MWVHLWMPLQSGLLRLESLCQTVQLKTLSKIFIAVNFVTVVSTKSSVSHQPPNDQHQNSKFSVKISLETS